MEARSYDCSTKIPAPWPPPPPLLATMALGPPTLATMALGPPTPRHHGSWPTHPSPPWLLWNHCRCYERYSLIKHSFSLQSCDMLSHVQPSLHNCTSSFPLRQPVQWAVTSHANYVLNTTVYDHTWDSSVSPTWQLAHSNHHVCGEQLTSSEETVSFTKYPTRRGHIILTLTIAYSRRRKNLTY